jgi:hypothetical protein
MIYIGEAFLGRMAAPPPPPSPVSRKLSLFLILPVCRRSSLLAGEEVGEKPNIRSRESLALYNSFYTPCGVCPLPDISLVQCALQNKAQYCRVMFSDRRLCPSHTVSFSDDEFVIGPCRSTATHDNDRK